MSSPPLTLDSLEAALERAVARFDDGSATGAQIRYHFGFGEDGARAGAASGCGRGSCSKWPKKRAAGAAEALAAACAVEIIHEFSLIHDDIEDGDRLRRGRETLWARFGARARHQRRRRAVLGRVPHAARRQPRAAGAQARDEPRAARGAPRDVQRAGTGHCLRKRTAGDDGGLPGDDRRQDRRALRRGLRAGRARRGQRRRALAAPTRGWARPTASRSRSRTTSSGRGATPRPPASRAATSRSASGRSRWSGRWRARRRRPATPSPRPTRAERELDPAGVAATVDALDRLGARDAASAAARAELDAADALADARGIDASGRVRAFFRRAARRTA